MFRSNTSISERSDDFDVDAMRKEIEAEHEACVLAYRHIDLVAGGRVLHSEAELPTYTGPRKALYVWESECSRGLN